MDHVLDRTCDRAGAAGCVLLTVLVVILAQSVFWAGHVPPSMKLAIAAVGVLSFFRAPDGLLVVVGLAPLGHMMTTRIFDAYPARGTEALVLAFLAAWALRRVMPRAPASRDRQAPIQAALPPVVPPALLTPVLLFGAIVLASCAVQYSVVQTWQDHAWPFFQRLLAFVATGYHELPGDFRPWAAHAGFDFVAITAFTLEGPALFLVTLVLCRREPRLVPAMVRMVVAGAVAASLLSLAALATAALSEPEPLGALPGLLRLRWAVFTSKVNTAASLFVLAAPLAVGAAASARRSRSGWILASGIIVAALWINGTRAALLAAVFVLLVALVWLVLQRGFVRAMGLPAIVGILLLCASLGSAAFYRVYVTSERAVLALKYRILFTETGVRMFGSRPLFGVGIGQYYLHSQHFAPDELAAMAPIYERSTAHNQVLQVAAELGASGVLAFTWVLAVPLWLILTAARSSQRDALLLGALGGIAAYLITTLSSGHPMRVEVTNYPFWAVLGLAVARALESRTAGGASAVDRARPAGRVGPGASRRPWKVGTALGVILVLISLPVRLAQATGEIDLARVVYGTHEWEVDSTGSRYRWSEGRTTLFAPSGSVVIVPLRAWPTPSLPAFHVELLVDGHLAGQVHLTDASWRPVELHVAATSRARSVPITLAVTPTWRPADVLPGSRDTRELGVMIGEMTITTRPSGR